MILSNQQLPPFTALDIHGNTVSSSDLKGKRVYISFLRTASCPFCNLRVHQLIQQQEAWKKKGITTIAVFASSASDILNYAGKQAPPFTIIADPNEVLYKQFHIGHSMMGMFKAMLRFRTMLSFTRKGFFNLNAMTDKPVLTGDFLVDETGKVQFSYYGKDFGDHISFADIDKWINRK